MRTVTHVEQARVHLKPVPYRFQDEYTFFFFATAKAFIAKGNVPAPPPLREHRPDCLIWSQYEH